MSNEEFEKFNDIPEEMFDKCECGKRCELCEKWAQAYKAMLHHWEQDRQSVYEIQREAIAYTQFKIDGLIRHQKSNKGSGVSGYRPNRNRG